MYKCLGTMKVINKRKQKLFFFFREFQPMGSASNDTLYHQTKTPIGFWCKQGLNFRSLIQPSETLPVKIIGIHILSNIKCHFKFIMS